MSGCSLTHLRGCGFTHPNMFRSVVASIRRRSIPSTENNNNNSKHMHNVIMQLKMIKITIALIMSVYYDCSV